MKSEYPTKKNAGADAVHVLGEAQAAVELQRGKCQVGAVDVAQHGHRENFTRMCRLSLRSTAASSTAGAACVPSDLGSQGVLGFIVTLGAPLK